MDTFMDKFAQKLTAQEMIKANTAADAEEMNQLKKQVQEYREILEQMKKLIEDGAAKLEGAKVDGSEINSLVEKEITRINSLVEEGIAKINKLVEEGTVKVNHLAEEGIGKINRMQQNTQEIDKLQESFGHLEETLGTKMDSVLGNSSFGHLEETLGAKLDSVLGTTSFVSEHLGETLDAKLENTNENIHKECVKVYRNVQAVVVDENNKQTESVVAPVKSMNGKMSAILGVSVAALVAAVGSVVFQLLVYLNVI